MKNKYIFNTVFGLAVFIFLYIISRFNYPLFHSITEMITVFIAASVFIIIWNGRHLLDNQYYLLISIGFLFLAFFDFMHMVGNKGMGVFPQYGNLGPTFYIISRYILSLSFFIAPFFIKRKVKTAIMFMIYTVISILVLLSVFYWQNFPVTYIEGTGLTTFKIISDYSIDFILLAALGLLIYNRHAFDARVLKYIYFSLILFIATGLSFTLYTDPFGLTNAIGHFLQIISFSLVFLTFVETGLAKPQNLLFRNLTQSNEEIQKLNMKLENVNDDLMYSIAELEKTDAALKISEAQANSLIKLAPTAIFEVDLIKQRFTSVNEAMCKMSGYTREELFDIDPMDLLDEESGKNLAARIIKRFSLNNSSDFIEYRVKKKDGSFIYMVFNISFNDDSLDKVFVIGHDVTIRRMYENQLRESEERFRTLSETSLVGVGVSSTEGDILYANQSYEQILGYDHAELIGTKADNVYWNPGDRNYWVNKLFSDGPIRDLEVRLKRKDGLPVWVSISASLITYGGYKAVMSTIQDISARKKAEEGLKHYAAELEASNKELEAFAYSLSHDLRAPLRALDGFSQAILEDYKDILDAAGNDYLMRIRSAAQNMAQITEGMLKLSEVIRYDIHWEKVCLSETVSMIAQDLREKDPEREIEFYIAKNIYANGDPSLLRILLYNLLENSWKFTSKSRQARIEFNSTKIDGVEVFFVKDNGIGFDMQYSGNLFQPFQRLHPDNNFPGHGIGLATVLRVVSRHGGEIWADSEIGKGTTFFFRLGDYGMQQ
ncbi:MAG: MASE3 domain-containing protein [Saccharofermentanales bacterium]